MFQPPVPVRFASLVALDVEVFAQCFELALHGAQFTVKTSALELLVQLAGGDFVLAWNAAQQLDSEQGRFQCVGAFVHLGVRFQRKAVRRHMRSPHCRFSAAHMRLRSHHLQEKDQLRSIPFSYSRGRGANASLAKVGRQKRPKRLVRAPRLIAMLDNAVHAINKFWFSAA